MKDALCSYLYLSIRTAFAHMQRIGVDSSNPPPVMSGIDVRSRFSVMNGRKQYLKEIAAAALSNHLVSEPVRCLTRRLHDVTWNSVEGCNEVISASRGSMAGTPLADITFIGAISIYIEAHP